MAKLSKIVNNNRRKRLSSNKLALRVELRKKVKNINLPDEERYEAMLKLQKLPKNSSEVRVRNRCEVTGRPRAFYRKFKLSRITFRELALKGMIPGVTKSSW